MIFIIIFARIVATQFLSGSIIVLTSLLTLLDLFPLSFLFLFFFLLFIYSLNSSPKNSGRKAHNNNSNSKRKRKERNDRPYKR